MSSPEEKIGISMVEAAAFTFALLSNIVWKKVEIVWRPSLIKLTFVNSNDDDEEEEEEEEDDDEVEGFFLAFFRDSFEFA